MLPPAKRPLVAQGREWYADTPKQWFFNACQNLKLPQLKPKTKKLPGGGFQAELTVPVGVSSAQCESL